MHFILTLPVTIGIVSLFVYQINIARHGTTSIETLVYKRYRNTAKRFGMRNFVWFHDFGWKQNLKLIFGMSAADWFIGSEPEGEGTSWKTRIYKLQNDTKEDNSGMIFLPN